MYKKLIFIAVMFLLNTAGKTQIGTYQQLIDSATSHSGLFVGKAPMRPFHLELDDTIACKTYLEETVGYKITPKLLVELIKKSLIPDTGLWTDKELSRFILVDSINQYVYLKEVLKKFEISDKTQVRFYRRKINDFNYTKAWDKEVFYFSRPVFDSSQKIAIISFDYGHSGFGGGGAVTLYALKDGGWKEIGSLTRWRH